MLLYLNRGAGQSDTKKYLGGTEREKEKWEVNMQVVGVSCSSSGERRH